LRTKWHCWIFFSAVPSLYIIPQKLQARLVIVSDGTVHHFSNQLTYSVEQSPSSEANRSSASQEILRILLNPKVHYCV